MSAHYVRGLGTILVDAQGYTLYAYVPDHQAASRCYRACESSWPPLALSRGDHRPAGGPGIRQALLGTTRRKNGELQVTYDHWPLYRYQNDHEPGEVAGQGADMGLWYVIDVGGSLDRRALPASSS